VIRLISTPLGADVSRGAYVIKPATAKHVRVTIVATGSEVPLAIRVAEKLGNFVQVVSMPSVADFRMQDLGYKQKILSGFVVALEAAATAPWFEFADAVVGIDRFGMSGDGDFVYSSVGFDADIIARDIKEKIK
jgi:transketolase